MMVLSVARSCARRNLSGKPALQMALRYWSGGRFAFFRWWAIGAALLARTLLGCRLRGGQE
jgi:hypothetical protein